MRTIGLVGGMSWHSTLEYYRIINERIAERRGGHAHANGWTRLGLVGTWWVMDEPFYADRLRAAGLTVDLPSHEDRVEVDRIIFEELTQGRVLDGSRAAYVEVIRRLQDAGADALASACTELELLVGPDDSPLPILESLRIHAEAGADWALER